MDKSVKIVFLLVFAVLFTLLMNAQHFLFGEVATAVFALGIMLIIAGITSLFL